MPAVLQTTHLISLIHHWSETTSPQLKCASLQPNEVGEFFLLKVTWIFKNEGTLSCLPTVPLADLNGHYMKPFMRSYMIQKRKKQRKHKIAEKKVKIVTRGKSSVQTLDFGECWIYFRTESPRVYRKHLCCPEPRAIGFTLE